MQIQHITNYENLKNLNNLNSTASQRLAYIDSWRTIAVALVIISHLSHNMQINDFFISHHLNFLFVYGQLGVLIFFFISGLVVSKAGLDEVHISSAFSVPGFYIRRAFRIIPPLMIYLTFCLCAGAMELIDFTLNDFLGSSLYLCNTSLPFIHCGWYSGHTWSLAFEEQFYLIFPVIFCFIELKKAPNYYTAIFILILALPLIFDIPFIGKTGFFAIQSLFLMGYIASKYKHTFDSWIAKSPKTILFVSTACSFIVIPVLKKYFGSDIYILLYALTIPLMILSSGNAGSNISKILRNKVFGYFGKISYSIYLWQQLVTSEIFSNTHYLTQLAMVSGVIVFSVISYEYFEKQMIRLGRKIAANNA